MENVLVSIPGGNGRMGKTLIGLILEHTKLDLAHATCLPGEVEEGMDIGLLVGKGKISKELKLFVDSKVIKDSDKRNALRSIFKDSSKRTKDLIELLTKNRRIDLFDDVASSFVVLYNDHVQNQEVILTSSSLLYTSTIITTRYNSNF